MTSILLTIKYQTHISHYKWQPKTLHGDIRYEHYIDNQKQ